MDEKIRQIAREEAFKINDGVDTVNQFGVAQNSFHTHNGLDSLQIAFKGLSDTPVSYQDCAGLVATVNSTENAIEFTVPTIPKQTVYASGTAYSLTNTAALLDFGTTDPTLTITTTGTYMLFGQVRLDYTGATFAANRTITLKLRKTNATAADITSATISLITPIITTLTYTAGIIQIPPTFYAATAADIIQIWGSIDVVPSAGTVDATQASLIALRVL